ncbi:acetylglutamate kinase [Candidatus Woesearchaeota archaeon]|nr:acetylglutamate kinase [Candidatus Woesearchaeota archaeon]
MKETAMKILRSFGLDKELELYLQMFQKTPRHKFAVVKISGSTLEEKMRLVAEDLAFLSKLGLTPIVIHGGGKQIDKELQKKGIVSKKVDGLRVTDKETMKIVKKTITALSSKLTNEINTNGGRAINATALELIEAQKAENFNGVDLGFVGSVKKVKIDKLRDLCKSGYIPILGSVGYDDDDCAYNINADNLASWLVNKIQPKKFILVTETGGVLDKKGNIISTIDIQFDLPDLIKKNVITEGMLLKVLEIKTLLQNAPQTVVEVCSAENILQELFTVKGSGTFIRYGGSFIIKESFNDVNTQKIKKLLEESFCKMLVGDYFEQPIDCVIVDKEYTGVMIIKKIQGTAYLDKLAIAKSAQGNGLAKAMWSFVKMKYPSLIWRSSVNNPINNWYFKNCDGVEKSNTWIIFWYNLDRNTVHTLFPLIMALPATMVKR